jgi:paraquat-inducible protein A
MPTSSSQDRGALLAPKQNPKVAAAPRQAAPTLVACHECDELQSVTSLARCEVAHCVRCGATIAEGERWRPEPFAAFVLATLIVFLIANAFPIVRLEVQGTTTETTLFGAVYTLYAQHQDFIALLVLATTMAFPMIELSLLVGVLLTLRRFRATRGYRLALRLIQALRPWKMIEVFMIGVMVALVKLWSIATIIPGAALWAFAVLTFMLGGVAMFDPAHLWRRVPLMRDPA